MILHLPVSSHYFREVLFKGGGEDTLGVLPNSLLHKRDCCGWWKQQKLSCSRVVATDTSMSMASEQFQPANLVKLEPYYLLAKPSCRSPETCPIMTRSYWSQPDPEALASLYTSSCTCIAMISGHPLLFKSWTSYFACSSDLPRHASPPLAPVEPSRPGIAAEPLSKQLRLYSNDIRECRDIPVFGRHFLLVVQISRDMPHYSKRQWSLPDLEALQSLGKQLRMYCAKIRAALAPIRRAVSTGSIFCW